MTTQPTKQRLPLLDIMRGIALIAMAIYHFGWDLGFFGYVSPALVNDGPWKIFARCIASSFLFLVGVSLVLTHGKAINWQGFWKRWIKVAAAALVITIATYWFTPDAFIFFGILHQIAFASVAGLLLVWLPAPYLVTLGLFVIGIGQRVDLDALNGLYLAWTGLQSEAVRSNDYVPVFPWFGAVLIGMGLSRWLIASRVFTAINQSQVPNSRLGKGLGFLGRHSLVFYLVHQPIMIAFIYVFSLIYPANNTAPSVEEQFLSGWIGVPNETVSDTTIEAYCQCTIDGAKKADVWDDMFEDTMPKEKEDALFAVYDSCMKQYPVN